MDSEWRKDSFTCQLSIHLMIAAVLPTFKLRSFSRNFMVWRKLSQPCGCGSSCATKSDLLVREGWAPCLETEIPSASLFFRTALLAPLTASPSTDDSTKRISMMDTTFFHLGQLKRLLFLQRKQRLRTLFQDRVALVEHKSKKERQMKI